LKFIVRMDDACPGMNSGKWASIEKILDAYMIKPVIAVIPDDKYFSTKEYTTEFWDNIRKWRDKGWEIALHGLTHLVKKNQPADHKYIFFAEKSEFAGLGFEEQGELLKDAYAIFNKEGIQPRIFIAPNHGFDSTTIRALREYTPIRIISDGIALHPYTESGFTFIPQLDWKLKNGYRGLRTICLHPSTMNEKEISFFESSLKIYAGDAITVDDVLGRDLAGSKMNRLVFAFFFKAFFRAKNFLYSKLK
jgi:predicted deacetylase